MVQMLRAYSGKIPKEAVNRGKADVAGTNYVVAVILEMVEEGNNIRNSYVFNRQVRNRHPLMLRDKHQKEFQAVPVTEDGMGTHPRAVAANGRRRSLSMSPRGCWTFPFS